MRFHSVCPGILVAVATFLPFFALYAPSARAEVETLVVQQQQLPLLRHFDGRVEAIHAAMVSGQTSGRVADILFDVGDTVPAGATIIRLVSEEQQGGLQQAEAAQADAQAGLNVEQRELQRIEELFAKGVVSKAELERAQGRTSSRKAQLENAAGALRRARQQLAYTRVQAPFAGVVSERHIELGEAVAPGTPLMSGFDPEHLRVLVDIPQGIAATVRLLPLAQVNGDSGSAITPRDILVYPVADTRNGTVKVRLNLPQGSHGLLPGQWVKVAFELGQEAQLLIPRSAVLQRSQLSGVYVQTAEGIALRHVRLGKLRGEQVEVSAGLTAGDRVVLDPLQALLLQSPAQGSGGASLND